MSFMVKRDVWTSFHYLHNVFEVCVIFCQWTFKLHQKKVCKISRRLFTNDFLSCYELFEQTKQV